MRILVKNLRQNPANYSNLVKQINLALLGLTVLAINSFVARWASTFISNKWLRSGSASCTVHARVRVTFGRSWNRSAIHDQGFKRHSIVQISEAMSLQLLHIYQISEHDVYSEHTNVSLLELKENLRDEPVWYDQWN